MASEQWRVLALCHERRNVAEYEGHLDLEERLVSDLIKIGEVLLKKVAALGVIK